MLNCLLPTLALSTFPLEHEAAVIPSPFCLASAHARCLTPPRYCLLSHGNHVRPSVGAHHRQKTSGETKKSGLVASIGGSFFLSSMHSFCYSGAVQSGRICFQPLPTISNDIKQHTMANKGVIIEQQRSPTSHLHYPATNLHFALFSTHNDYLLRLSRCCQLLLPSGP